MGKASTYLVKWKKGKVGDHSHSIPQRGGSMRNKIIERPLFSCVLKYLERHMGSWHRITLLLICLLAVGVYTAVKMKSSWSHNTDGSQKPNIEYEGKSQMPTVGSYLYKMQNYSKPESMIFLGIHTYIVTFKKKTEVKSKKKKSGEWLALREREVRRDMSEMRWGQSSARGTPQMWRPSSVPRLTNRRALWAVSLPFNLNTCDRFILSIIY